MAGFAGSIVVGIAAGNAEHTILYRALLALFVCYIVGWLVGLVAQRVIEDNIATYKRENPILNDPMKATPQPDAEGGSQQTVSTSKRAA